MSEEFFEVRDIRNGDWFWASKVILEHPQLNASDKLVYCSLAFFANRKTQKSKPGFTTIQDLTGLSRPTIAKSIKKLETIRAIKVIRKAGKVNLYELLKLTRKKFLLVRNQLKRRPGVGKKKTRSSSLTSKNKDHEQYKAKGSNKGYKKLLKKRKELGI